jgi:lipopolysaccharide/colanic/teichoic acid biosynthesis glycosyltransferase
VLDLAVAGLALALLSPLLLVVALAIRLDSRGSAVFRQQRVGLGGRPFIVLKFRTMRVAEPGEEVKFFKAENGGVSHKVRHDPRVTRVGRVLRKTSLDELPQLVNVLKGEMSLIGPRPELVSIVQQQYQPWQHRRHLVRPGITGWWQVCGRSDKPMHENTELDLYYVDHVSLSLDLRVLLRTVGTVVRGAGAF